MTPEQRHNIIKDFIRFCVNELEIDNLPQIKFTTDRSWATSRRSFGQYDANSSELIVYMGNRNLADLLRTLAHELVHHRQNELGHITNSTAGKTGSPIENQANSLAGILLRNYGQVNDLIYEACIPSLKEVYEANKSPKLQIYCDMDGVLCNFDKRFEYYFDENPREYRNKWGKKAFDEKISEAGIQFWAGMEWMPGGQELWSVISKYNPIILSSPGNFKSAEEGKKIWIEKHIGANQPAIFKQSGHKQEAIEGKDPAEIKRSILIDDHYTNILPWKEIGAIGIFYKSANQVLSILNKFNIK